MKVKSIIKWTAVILLCGFVIGGYKAYDIYQKAFAPNIDIHDGKDTFLYIKTGSSYDDVVNQLIERGIVVNANDFNWVAKKKNYNKLVKPGRYLIKDRMSNNELVNLLRSGRQEPLNVTFNNIRTLDNLAEHIGDQIEAHPDSLKAVFHSPHTWEQYGFEKETFKCMFIPNTYEFYWNTLATEFIERMYKEYNAFWHDERMVKLQNVNLSKTEVITLASIVDRETAKNDEKATIAGVYMNRLQIGMRLQADPTVVYAVGDFSIKRVLKRHYKLNSPYNTYRVAGLPPGPICIPDITSIDAVLNYENHKYLYFCAKADFSGYHVFARTHEQHIRNANKYRRELNKRRIYR